MNKIELNGRFRFLTLFLSFFFPGVMEVHAKFDLDNKPDGHFHEYMPYLLARRYAQGSTELEEVWRQDYSSQTFVLKPGVHLTPEFRQRLEMPSNYYLATVGFHEREWRLDDAGEPYLVESPPGVDGPCNSAWHVVH